jgi:hypothetical protein
VPAQTPKAGASKAAERKFADAPSDANKAPLDQTLKWLKQRLSEDSVSVPRPGNLPLRFEPVNFSGCRIKYRYTAGGDIPSDLLRDRATAPPPVPSNPSLYVAPPSEHRLHLADLNPDSMIFESSKAGSVITFMTQSLERKVSVVTFPNEFYRGDFATQNAFVTFRLKKTEAAASIRAALVHAINLCQAQP